MGTDRDIERAKEALRKVAALEKRGVDEVRRDIAAALKLARANPDPAVQAQWRKIPRRGEVPTPEEVIAFLMRRVENK